MAKAKRAKKQAAKKQDTGMRELLDLLKTHPHLMHALGVDPAKVNRLLKSDAARQLTSGVDPGPDAILFVTVQDPSNKYGPVAFRCLKRSN